MNMKNKYLNNLERVEFIITYACTGKCKHCSQGEHPLTAEVINAEAAVKALKEITQNYPIRSIMTFGGEPLIYADRVYQIHKAAAELNIPKRQLITNGFFSRDEGYISTVAKNLADCGVNDLLLSVDAFHEESIPMNYVKLFAKALVKEEVQTRISPAWLVSPDAENPYNIRTREILSEFIFLGLALGEGNVIFPKGNALKYLAEYIDINAKDPYEDDPENIKAISIEPKGKLLGENISEKSALEILSEYKPEERK